MAYQECLEKAGAEIISFKEFGSYQGEWMAMVRFNGETGIVQGYYGSCSGCDSYEAEFAFTNEVYEEDGKFYNSMYSECSKEEYDAAKLEQNEKERQFGLGYLSTPLESKAYFEKRLKDIESKDDWFSEEEKESIQWAIDEFNKLGI